MLKSNAQWTTQDSAELYEIERWGRDYFSINADGNVTVQPKRNVKQDVKNDVKNNAAIISLVEKLQERGVRLPILLRFSGILQDRLEEIHSAFGQAQEEFGHQGEYRAFYPIKVNQQRQIVEEIVEFGRPHHVGLEAGSKPELLAVLPMAGDRDDGLQTPIICNGFKDREYIHTALLASKAGAEITIVIENPNELDLVVEESEALKTRPRIGMRVKLSARGAGRWQESGGSFSKFGLTISQLNEAYEKLEAAGKSDCFELLHFHLGSQITKIRSVKNALIEAARIYVSFWQRGAQIRTIDVGGGLGVDYDGSQTSFSSSMNYTLEEYAADVVYQIVAVCDEVGAPHPNIASECGRAIVAYHSVLVFDIVGNSKPSVRVTPPLPKNASRTLQDLQDILHSVSRKNLLESFHDAQQQVEISLNLFSTGHLTLQERVVAEQLATEIYEKIQWFLDDDVDEPPNELKSLRRQLAQIYFANFSLFQSLPDSWAIKQLFPVMPIHRLNERPNVMAVIGDMTCDSDGKIDRFIDHRDIRSTLPVHALNGEPYILAAFLVGAYQEILGDLHNLFGDTNVAHVRLNDAGEVELRTVIRGDRVRDVLRYVQFNDQALLEKMAAIIERAKQRNFLTAKEAEEMLKTYSDGLQSYTYLE